MAFAENMIAPNATNKTPRCLGVIYKKLKNTLMRDQQNRQESDSQTRVV